MHICVFVLPQVFVATFCECSVGLIVDMAAARPVWFPLCDHSKPGHPAIGRWYYQGGPVEVGVGEDTERVYFQIDYMPVWRRASSRRKPQFNRDWGYRRFKLDGPENRGVDFQTAGP